MDIGFLRGILGHNGTLVEHNAKTPNLQIIRIRMVLLFTWSHEISIPCEDKDSYKLLFYSKKLVIILWSIKCRDFICRSVLTTIGNHTFTNIRIQIFMYTEPFLLDRRSYILTAGDISSLQIASLQMDIASSIVYSHLISHLIYMKRNPFTVEQYNVFQWFLPIFCTIISPHNNPAWWHHCHKLTCYKHMANNALCYESYLYSW